MNNDNTTISNNNFKTVIGFDVGSYKIGVAIAQTVTRTASALTTLYSKLACKPDWFAISVLLDEWKPELLIVGLPLQLDGSPQQMTQLARRFGNQLKGRYNLPVVWIDERLTSREAESIIKNGFNDKKINKNRNSDKNTSDAIAAQLIVQSWLDHPQHAITELTKRDA